MKLTDAQREALVAMATALKIDDHDGTVSVRGSRAGAYRKLVTLGLAECTGVDRSLHERYYRITKAGEDELRAPELRARLDMVARRTLGLCTCGTSNYDNHSFDCPKFEGES